MNLRDIALSGSFNTRDLGGYATTHGYIKWGKVFRSATLAHLDTTGQQTLKDLGIRRVIDLRSPQERIAEPDRIDAASGIERIEISLFDDLDPYKLPPGDRLLQLYLQVLKTQGPNFVCVLRAIINSPGAVLFHCTAGKDRTGLVAALVLALMGVSTADIIADYALTASRIGPLLQHFETTAKNLALDTAAYMPLLECRPDTLQQALDWLTQQYQTAERYLLSHGLTPSELTQLRLSLDEGQAARVNSQETSLTGEAKSPDEHTLSSTTPLGL